MDSESEEKLRRFGLEYYGLYYSVYKGIVTDNADPQDQGRIKVRLPELGRDDPLELFAYPISPFAGPGHGFFFPPEVDARVWVMFEGGNPTLPLYLGGWWSNPSKAPGGSQIPVDAYAKGQAPLVREIRTKAGHRIIFDDGGSAPGITIQTANGCIVQLADSSQAIKIIAAQDVTIQSTSATVEATQVSVKANIVSVDGALVRINGGAKFAAAIGDQTVGGATSQVITGPPTAGRPLIP
jgi:uncharacterized protein involved in type VI secretion and phage assembly